MGKWQVLKGLSLGVVLTSEISGVGSLTDGNLNQMFNRRNREGTEWCFELLLNVKNNKLVVKYKQWIKLQLPGEVVKIVKIVKIVIRTSTQLP